MVARKPHSEHPNKCEPMKKKKDIVNLLGNLCTDATVFLLGVASGILAVILSTA
jgi:hypothetical protein